MFLNNLIYILYRCLSSVTLCAVANPSSFILCQFVLHTNLPSRICNSMFKTNNLFIVWQCRTVVYKEIHWTLEVTSLHSGKAEFIHWQLGPVYVLYNQDYAMIPPEKISSRKSQHDTICFVLGVGKVSFHLFNSNYASDSLNPLLTRPVRVSILWGVTPKCTF